jgi:hypothetical protein
MMKTRIVKLYQHWVVEFPFSVVVYCETWRQAREAFQHFDEYLLSSRGPL